MNTAPRKHPSRKPFQFGVGTLLVLTTVLAAGLGILKWLGAGPLAISIVLGVLAVSAVAGVGLVVALTAALGDEEDDRR
jgi:hypothetical protein